MAGVLGSNARLVASASSLKLFSPSLILRLDITSKRPSSPSISRKACSVPLKVTKRSDEVGDDKYSQMPGPHFDSRAPSSQSLNHPFCDVPLCAQDHSIPKVFHLASGGSATASTFAMASSRACAASS